MTAIPFCKFHGFGNDYIVMEHDLIPENVRLADLAKSICHRHTGAGADGIAVVRSDRIPHAADSPADFFCEIVNPDGSIAGFSGNGTRCAVSYVYYKKLWDEPNLRLKTRSGVKNYRLIDEIDPGHYWFEAEIGQPKFGSSDIPFVSTQPREDVLHQSVTVNGRTFNVCGVNVGNPVACLFVDSFEEEWREIGKTLETHPVFPERANIVFVRVVDDENLEIKIWERGVGETSSSGTCVSGAAALSAYIGYTGRKLSVHTDGGVTEFVWRDDGEIVITGRADLAYCGEWPLL